MNAMTSLKIIDADTHLTEPHDLWLKRAPESLRDRVPQVKEKDGKRQWVIDGDKVIGFEAMPSSALLKDGGKVRRLDDFLKLKIEEVHPGSWGGKERLKFMDDNGIWGQIVYPNILGFGGQVGSKVDPALRIACVQIYNDAGAEMQEESGNRLLPMAMLPWWDVKEAVKETRRSQKLGLRGININSDPHLHKDQDGNHVPDLASRHWDPLWEVCQELDMPINFHIGASEQSDDWLGTLGWPSLSMNLKGGLAGAMLAFNNGRVLANIIYSGALDRHPRLKFVSVESGIGWIPFMLEALDFQLVETAEGDSFNMKPSEYFRRNFHACFWFETKHIAETIRQVGVDNVLFETDFPHISGLFPCHNLESRVSALNEEERAKVLSKNAIKLYSIPVT